MLVTPLHLLQILLHLREFFMHFNKRIDIIFRPLAQTFTVSLYPSQPRIGESYTVNAISSGLRVSADQVTIELYDSQLGQRQRCVGTTTCSYISTEWQSGTKEIYAIMRTSSGETMRSDSWRLSY